MNHQLILTLTTAGAAMLFDIGSGRIPNPLVLTAAMTGLVYQVMTTGPMGILHFSTGMIIPAILLMPLFRFRMMGAGDIKLLMVLGGIVGFPDILRLMVLSIVAGGIVALVRMIFVTGFRERFLYLFRYVVETGKSNKIAPYRKPGKRPENFPFAVPVFAATVIMTAGKFIGR